MAKRFVIVISLASSERFYGFSKIWIFGEDSRLQVVLGYFSNCATKRILSKQLGSGKILPSRCICSS